MVLVLGLKIALLVLVCIQSSTVQGQTLPTCGNIFPSLHNSGCHNIQTLTELKNVVDSGITRLVLCPGTIAKEKSKEHPLKVKKKLDIICQVPSECFFRGGGSYIDVILHSGLDHFSAHGIVFSGSTNSAVIVRTKRSAAFCGCNFVGNGKPPKQGSAINTKVGAKVLVDSCLFQMNSAADGGAIYNQDSRMTIVNSTFERNNATVTGGAIKSSPLATIDILECTFENNTAPTGPAIFMRRDTIWTERGSVWRNNGDCDGVYVDEGGCFQVPENSSSYPTKETVTVSDPLRSPTVSPTKRLVIEARSPTVSPTKHSVIEARSPTVSPTKRLVIEANAFELGKLSRDHQTGLMISKGLEVRRFASSGKNVRFESTDATTQYSNKYFHFDPDGATCLTTENGGWAYVSNSENTRGPGGVYSLLFDKFGKTMDYIAVLENTQRNCAGGKTPWNTWISCEEWKRGQCFQCHPTKLSRNQTTLGGAQGGSFEAFTYDDRNRTEPVFFITEDDAFGALRRFRPRRPISDGPQILHGKGERTYLRILDDTHFEWTSDLKLGRNSANRHFPNSEGIDRRKNLLYFVSKKTRKMFTLNLDRMTYSRQEAGQQNNMFQNGPDNIHAVGDSLLYFTEDGGKNPGLFVSDTSGSYHTLFMADQPKYHGDETTGLAFSPSMKTLYCCLQEHGDCFSFTRKDGRQFTGLALNLRAHTAEILGLSNSLLDSLD